MPWRASAIGLFACRLISRAAERQLAEQTWIEAALNGPWGRALQPGIPVSPGEIIQEDIAAARAGAAIIHLHAYGPETGRQNDDAGPHPWIIEGIRSRTDALVYPMIPLAGSGLTGSGGSAAQRFAHVRELARRGFIHMTVVDPGSVNFSRRDPLPGADQGFVCLDPEDHILEGLRVSADSGLTPSYTIYEPGFTRFGAVLAARFPGLRRPLDRFMSSDAFAWGFPPRRFAFRADRIGHDAGFRSRSRTRLRLLHPLQNN
jgi:hypothetical protein